MKRNYQTESAALIDPHDLIKQIAFHEAGHAAGIYLYNKQKRLPSVFFQINQSLKLPDPCLQDCYVASVEGGYLIDNLPLTLIESADYFSSNAQDALQTAFEADMINLLVGALAEAKYVALREGEHFDNKRAAINTLHFYGGSSDLLKVNGYLERFIACAKKREQKMIDLLANAFEFIDRLAHWEAIERLADYILTSKKSSISSEDAIEVLENSVA